MVKEWIDNFLNIVFDFTINSGMDFKSFGISVYFKKLVMAHPKELHTQYENQTVKQDFDNPKHLLISSNAFANNGSKNYDARAEKEINNEIFYQFNLDDWQG